MATCPKPSHHACMYVCMWRAMTEVWFKWDVHRIMKFVCNNAGFSFPFYCLLDCSALFLSLYGQIWQKFPTDHVPRLKSFGKCGNDYRLLHAYRYRKDTDTFCFYHSYWNEFYLIFISLSHVWCFVSWIYATWLTVTQQMFCENHHIKSAHETSVSRQPNRLETFLIETTWEQIA